MTKPKQIRLDLDRTRHLFLCLDDLRYSIAVVSSSFSRVKSHLLDFEAAEVLDVSTHLVGQVMGDLWSIVDAMYKINIILARTPLLSKRMPEIKVFGQSAKEVERLRHYIQHLDREIGRTPPFSSPLWGGFSWVSHKDQYVCYVLQTGGPYLAHSQVGIAFDTIERKFVRNYELSVGDVSIDPKQCFDAASRLSEFLKLWSADLLLSGDVKYVFDPGSTPLVKMVLQVRL